MALTVKCLPLKYKDLSLNPRSHERKLGVAAYACNLRTGEVETGRPLSTGQSDHPT